MSGRSAVELAILRDLLKSSCEEMGMVLCRSAYSVNIRERRDYSTAVFDSVGRCVVAGDHMPVHLGSMPLAVAGILADRRLGSDDIAIANDPYRGGTHLPDITMVKPIYRDNKLIGHVACRAHHADIGGMTPGSMPLAREICQEGVRIPPILLYRKGNRAEDVLNLLLANVRTPGEREGDIEAQRACLEQGARRVLAVLSDPARLALLPELLRYTRRATRRLIREFPLHPVTAEDVMDDDGLGSGPITVRLTVRRRAQARLEIDFRGCPDAVAGSINSPRAVTVSAVAYAVRCLLSADVPMNSGTLADVSVLTRPGSLLDARPPSAVCGGNVETSQRLVDLLLDAFSKALPGRDLPAASQGTMNNISFGGAQADGKPFAYYETVGGGAGASAIRKGASAVHTHMTNSRNTSIEILEQRYPVSLVTYAVRRGSGGRGRNRGGDGIIREFRFASDVELSLLTERRKSRPYGRAGGSAGLAGRNTLIDGGTGRKRRLPAKVRIALRRGDRLRIETPGGGGYGPPGSRG